MLHQHVAKAYRVLSNIFFRALQKLSKNIFREILCEKIFIFKFALAKPFIKCFRIVLSTLLILYVLSLHQLAAV